MSGIPRILVVAGLVLVAAGLAWPLLAKIGIGRLPGDLLIERGNFRFYFPLTTILLVNVLLWIVMRLFGGK
ncbi:MAG TPA: DUF2905 domain-containing protein [Candidatus Limnocylindrales bacterium]|nr:DUF2905 domain-containing protein [Candidatus Limnocylindrales bacterium]